VYVCVCVEFDILMRIYCVQAIRTNAYMVHDKGDVSSYSLSRRPLRKQPFGVAVESMHASFDLG